MAIVKAMQQCSLEMSMVWRKCCNFSWVINERKTEVDTLLYALHVAWEDPAMCCIDRSFMDYSLQGYSEKGGGRRDSKEI